MTTDRRAPTRSWRWMCRRYSSRNRPKKKKQKSTCLSCSVETNQTWYIQVRRLRRGLFLRRGEGKKGRRKLGRQRVEKMMIVVLSPLYRTDSFFSNHWCDPRLLFFVSSSYNRCYRKCSLSVRHRHLRLTYTHSLTHTHICMYTYIFIYISLSPSAEAGALAAMQESAKPV